MSDDDVPDELVGQELAGRYRLVRRLGEGGMGAVYLARQQPLDREVVVKVMRDELARDPAYRDRFVREAKAISALSNPNIVALFDFGVTDQGVLFLAMERLKGRTLHALVQEDGPLEEERCLGIVTGILRALAEVHAIGIMHRDLKPENVFITTSSTGEEIVKVLDFGLAKQMQTKDSKREQQSAIVGTPGYMAPEQMKGDEIGPATDIYALGIIWWEMLVGRRVFDEVEDHHERMLKLVVEGVPPPSSVRPLNLVLGHEALVMRMLAKDPAARPQDAAACLPLLRAVAGAAWNDVSGEFQVASASARADAFSAIRGGWSDVDGRRRRQRRMARRPRDRGRHEHAARRGRWGRRRRRSHPRERADDVHARRRHVAGADVGRRRAVRLRRLDDATAPVIAFRHAAPRPATSRICRRRHERGRAARARSQRRARRRPRGRARRSSSASTT